MNAQDIAQRQLDFYNNHDLEGFASVYTDDVKVYNLVDHALMFEGQEELRKRYGKRFENKNLHAKLINRMVIGNKVIDHEEVVGIKESGVSYAIAIYETQGDLIKTVWFLHE